MLKMVYEEQTTQGWSYREQLFSSGEAVLAVQFAREMVAQPVKFRSVVVYDFRCPVRKVSVPLLPRFDHADPVMTWTALPATTTRITRPACRVLDLSKAPKVTPTKATAKTKAGVGVSPEVFAEKPARKPRVSKRARQFALAVEA